MITVDGGIHWSYDAGTDLGLINTIARSGSFMKLASTTRSRITFAVDCNNGSWCGPVQRWRATGIVKMKTGR